MWGCTVVGRTIAFKEGKRRWEESHTEEVTTRDQWVAMIGHALCALDERFVLNRSPLAEKVAKDAQCEIPVKDVGA
jgi:hypothetical protein